jgi:hypothetical protein
LFGEKCINLTPNNDIFKVEFILPVDVEQSNRRNFYVDIPVQFLQNKEGETVANAHAFETLNENTQPWVNVFMKKNVAFIGGVPLADVLLHLQPIATNVNNFLVWISIQEPKDEFDAQQITTDLFLLKLIKKAAPLYNHILVYITSKFHGKKKVKVLMNIIKNNKSIDTETGILFVHDMSDLFPIFSHRCSFI